jgi:TonB-dependent SusC/RagA subfamily outer membrane receptor
VADQQALHAGVDRKVYQYSLLRLQQLLPGPVPATHFHSLTLKTRLQMMNRKPTRPAQKLRYLLAVPCCMALSLLSHARPLQAPASPTVVQSLFDAQPAEGVTAPALPAPSRQAPAARSTAPPPKSKVAIQKALIFVDGTEMPYAEMKKINPEIILSVNVLKDNDAETVAMYGERGRNGVLLITTKK